MTKMFNRETLQRAAFFVFMAMVPLAAERVWSGVASACGCGDACACGDACNCDHNVDR